jgi:hypothetical protein
MPIRKEFRQFYRGVAWREARRRILTRAGGTFDLLGGYLGGARCEACGKLDRAQVETRLSRGMIGGPRMWWRAVGSEWMSQDGEPMTPPRHYTVERFIRVVLAVVHLNHTPGDDRDANLKCLCQWHHLNWDLLEHRETRRTRKDLSRPLLALEKCS